MFSINLQYPIKDWSYWLLTIMLLMALKQYYSAANAAQLQWILYPLVLSLELFSDLVFEANVEHEWNDNAHHISIVKSCAGINFLIVSLLGYLWLWRNKPHRLQRLIPALILAWLTALASNTLRILLCINTQESLAAFTGLSQETSHLLIGVSIYFLCLWLQLAAFRLRNLQPMAVSAIFIYLCVTALIPIFRSLIAGEALPTAQYLAWVIGLPLGIILIIYSAIAITQLKHTAKTTIASFQHGN